MKGNVVADDSGGSREFVANNVVVVTFQQDSGAYEALTEVKQLGAQGQLEVQAGAVVLREPSGNLIIKDQAGDRRITGTATGGLLGLLIGVLAGPFGILLGGATGVLMGSLFDIEDEDDTESVLGEISQAVRPGQTALLAEVTEQSPEVLDAAMARLHGSVLRRPVAEVEAEIAAAEEAQREAKRHARKLLHEQRQAKQQATIHAKVEELKAKLHREHTAATAT
jgi:uncharacterized membrane protein